MAHPFAGRGVSREIRSGGEGREILVDSAICFFCLRDHVVEQVARENNG